MHWLYLGISIGAEVIGTSALKLSESFTRVGPSLVAILSYTLAFYLLSLALAHIPLGVAYAIWCGVGIALIAVVGALFFGDTLDLAAEFGILLIIAGISIITLASKTSLH